MKTLIALAGLALALLCQPAFAQDITGQWQGTLHGPRDLRLVIQIAKAPGGGFTGNAYSIDQSPQPQPLASVALAGSKLTFAVPSVSGKYEGELAKDGKSAKGSWTPGASTPLDFNLEKATKATAWALDPSPHKVSFVTTSDHVKLEVLDWGGTGRAILLIPGLGANAHVFDSFIPKLTGKYHVYGVTRRGYGASDHPDPSTVSYMADRLGDDVLAVIDALKLDKPVLGGWSLGGEEMSSIGSRHPEKVSGLIYLDAAYAYSFYSPGNEIPQGSNLYIDANDIKARIDRLNTSGVSAEQALAMIDELLKTSVPQLQADLQAAQVTARDYPASRPPAGPPPTQTLDSRIGKAILVGEQKYTKIDVPILAIFAGPQTAPANMTPERRVLFDRQATIRAEQVKRFRAGLPQAKVVNIPDGQHAIFLSNPDEVAREMIPFIDGLK